MTWLWVALGSALGGVSRYWLAGVVDRTFGATFPWGTTIVNVTGSLMIGLVAGLVATDGRWLIPSSARVFIMVGLCGGYTTYSSFALQTLTLARDGEWLRAGANVMLTTALCLIAVWAGYAAGDALNQMKG